MKNILGTVQKRIGLLISAVGSFVLITNFIRVAAIDGVAAGFRENAVWLLFLILVPFVVSIFIESNILKICQVGLMFLTGTLNVLEEHEEFYGPGLFLAAWLLMRHYGYLDRHRVAKNIFILVTLVVLSQISANINTVDGIYAGLTTLWYALFLTVMLIIIWSDMLFRQDALKNENRSLKMDYNQLANQLEEIENEHKPFNLKAARITPAEERVIKTLTLYRASNREIAERLDIAEPTVKLHLYNIYNKIGVDNRFAIIDLCKYNFIND